MIHKIVEAPIKIAPIKLPEACNSWNHGKCYHKAYKGADCPQDPQCLLWDINHIPRCIDCKEKSKEVVWDSDGGGPYCPKCHESLPDELKKFTV